MKSISRFRFLPNFSGGFAPKLTPLLAIYAVALGTISTLRPLWLDEVLQLIGTRNLSSPALLDYIRTFPGAAPLGYLVQRSVTNLLGFPLFSARLPSAVCSLVSCVGLLSLARLLRIRTPWFLLACWMVLPLTLRYALEGRPYAQALLFSVVSTALFFRLLARPSVVTSLLYAFSLVGGLYSVPYTVFLQLGYVGWAGIARRWRGFFAAMAALALAAVAYLPWYISSFRHWEAYDKVGFSLSPKFLLLPIKDITGGGFACSVPFLLLAWTGFRLASSNQRSRNAYLIAGTAAGLGFALASNSLFGYFFAIRQIMFILVPLTLLAAQGFSSLLEQPGKTALGALLAGALVIGSVVKDVRYFSDRSEDWAAGAAVIHSAVNRGACPIFITIEDAKLYGFFDPAIKGRTCPALAPIVVPISHYTKPEEAQSMRRLLSQQGYVISSTENAGGSVITVYNHKLAN